MATTQTPVDEETVREILSEWPEDQTETAEDLIETYGTPDEAAPSELLWYDNGPWKRTELYRDAVPHNFPKQHEDYLEQVIDYQIPPSRVDDITQFDGSVYVDRTNGELSAKCAGEASNFLALNLAHDVLEDQLSVDDARQAYAVMKVKQMLGAEPEYTTGLQFEVPDEKQRDPDESIVTDAMREQIAEELGVEDGED